MEVILMDSFTKLRKMQHVLTISKGFCNANGRIQGCTAIPEPGKFIVPQNFTLWAGISVVLITETVIVTVRV